jgi:hypothetical protein
MIKEKCKVWQDVELILHEEFDEMPKTRKDYLEEESKEKIACKT